MERVVQASCPEECSHSECWDGGSRNCITPFQLPDETPSWDEWRIHHDQEDNYKDCPLGVKERWCFGKVIFKRYYRHDWTMSGTNRVIGSWSRDSVNTAALRLCGINQVSCSYSIRVRGVTLNVSGGSRTLQCLIELAIRTKLQALQLTSSETESRLPWESIDVKHQETD
nr:MAG: hypothetical protein 2 [Tombusviridae sp.]